jgi:hypothetical protein
MQHTLYTHALYSIHSTLMHCCTHARIHSCIHTLMHSYTHAFIHSCTHALMHSCTHALMHSTIVHSTQAFAESHIYLPMDAAGAGKGLMYNYHTQRWLDGPFDYNGEDVGVDLFVNWKAGGTMHSHNILYTMHSHNILYTMHSHDIHYALIHYAPCTHTLCTIHYTLCTIHYTPYTHTIHSYTIHHALIHYTPYTLSKRGAFDASHIRACSHERC